jgi:hypothetical protein
MNSCWTRLFRGDMGCTEVRHKGGFRFEHV